MRQRKVLIVQFEVCEGESLAFFQGIEDVLVQAFDQNRFATVDGHDYGQGVFNIFIYPRRGWAPVLERVFAFLRLKGWLSRATIAKGLESGRWQLVWPERTEKKFQL